jgi:signal transduction histidine kinase
MSREGWQVFQAQHEDDTKGYRYDRSAVQPVTTAQLPEGSNGPTGIVEQSVATGDQGKSVVSTPMTVRGETIGALGIQEDPERPLEPEDHELLRSISVQVAEALESARLLEQTQKHAVAMEAVAQVSAAASTILDTPKLLETVTRLTKERFDLYHVAVFTLEDHKLHLSAGTAFPIRLADTEAAIVLEVYREKSLVARAARTRQPVLVNLVNRDPGYLPHPILPATRSELSIPLIVGEEILGVLDLQSNVANRFGEDDIRIHTTLAAQVAVALQNATLYAEQLKTAERLREVDRLKSEFLASMSHELRTPLNSIIGFADVLLEGIDGPLNERMNEDVSLIRDSGRHLRALIGEMLDMSKIEAGVMELHYEQINVPQFAQEIIANAKPLAVGKDLEISLNVAPGLNVIMADRTRLTQILLNLMSNAIKFTETGSITLSMGEHDGGLLASVKDTGIGIKQEDFPAIFEQFRQVDASLTRRIGGTGLGIPISKSLVELHGGQMWVDSKPGVGSTFSFTIPGKRMIGL